MQGDDYVAVTVGEGLLLGRRHGQRLFALNDSARFIWELRMAGVADDALAGELAEAYGIDPGIAAQDVRATLRHWQEQGLLQPGGRELTCEIGGRRFLFRFDSEQLAATLLPFFLPFVSGQQPAISSSSPEIAIEVTPQGGGYSLAGGDDESLSLATMDRVVEAVHGAVIRHVFNAMGWQFSVHGAAAGTGGRCVLMAGQSGSGKTTLLASLLGRGWMHIADDLAMVALDRLAVRPLPLALVLKQGSWPILEPHLPGLAGQAVFRRIGRRVKYWLPPAEQIARAPHDIAALVFPRFIAGAPLASNPLSAFESLARLMKAPTRIGLPLVDAVAQRLASWVLDCRAYDLTYGRVEDAADEVARLLQG